MSAPIFAMDPISRVLAAIESSSGKAPRKSGNGWEALCPAHEDKSESLSIAVGADGRTLLKCHAGCELDDVTRALGMAVADLFPPKAAPPTQRWITATYDYVDEMGALLFQVLRFHPKDFRQRRPDGRGGWIPNVQGLPRPLYRLPEVLRAVAGGQTVYVVEGEKDVDSLRALGFVATCNPLGAGSGKWRPEHTAVLRGAARVVVLPDKDKEGLAHGSRIGGALRAVGVDARELLLAGAGKDVTDWIRAGGTAAALERVVDEVWSEPHKSTPELGSENAGTIGNQSPPQTPPERLVPGSLKGPRERNQTLSSVEGAEPWERNESWPYVPWAEFEAQAESDPEPSWLIQNFIPSSGVVLMVSAPNAGKTWLTLAAIKAALGAKRDVFFAEDEGSRKDFVKRARAMGLAKDALAQLHVAHQSGCLLTDDRYIERMVKFATGCPAPVFPFDPLAAFFLGDEDTETAKMVTHRINVIRRANANALFLVLHHTSKNGEAGNGSKIYSSRGSTVFSGWCDTQLNLGEMPADGESIQFTVEVSKQRSFERAKPQHFRIDLGSGNVSVSEIEDRSDYSGRIIAALAKRKSPVSKSELTEAVRGRRHRVLEDVDELVSQGKVLQLKRGQYALPGRPRNGRVEEA